MAKWQPCPRCGSARVRAHGFWYTLLFGVMMAGCGAWLLIIPFIGIPAVIMGALMILISPAMANTLKCEDCRYEWRYRKKQPKS